MDNKVMWDIVKKISDNIKYNLRLYHWTYSFENRLDIEKDGSITYVDKYFDAKFRYNFESFEGSSFEDIFELIAHEFVHIFTSTWTQYFNWEFDQLALYIGKNQLAMIYNTILTVEEQKTCILAKFCISKREKEHRYKKLKKEVNNLLQIT